MYELVQAGEKSYYMDCPAKVGFYQTGAEEVVAIDSGSDRDAAKKVRRILEEKGWRLRAIYNTHSHADHIGGNEYLQSQTGCRIYAPGIEQCFTAYPVLEPTVLYGGFAPAELHHKFLMAKASAAEPLTPEVLPEGLDMLPLPGHSYDMAGFRTADGTVFLADALSSAETLDKYGLGYLYDVKAYLATLEQVKGMEARCFVPSHAPAGAEIAALAQLNIDKTQEIAARIEGLLTGPKGGEELLAEVFAAYGLTMNFQQYVLIGSTLRSYLSYLKQEGRIRCFFADNRLLWQKG